MLRNPKLTGQIFFGGLIQAGGPVKVVEDKEMSVQPQVQMTIASLRKEGYHHDLVLRPDMQEARRLRAHHRCCRYVDVQMCLCLCAFLYFRISVFLLLYLCLEPSFIFPPAES